MTSENPDFFHPATLLRLREEKQREKVFSKATVAFTGGTNHHQAPIANLGTSKAGVNGKGGDGARITAAPNGESFAAVPKANTAFGQLQANVGASQSNGGPRDSRGSPISGDNNVEFCSYEVSRRGDGANTHKSGREGGAADGGGSGGVGGGGGGGVYSSGPSLDIEVDVRKKVLELVSWLFGPVLDKVKHA